MENLAPELLDSIFTLACTDGGFTGCSLSSVSKHVRATSRGARFYSISLTRARLQMTQFLSCLLAERAVASIYTPTIRHLHIVSIKNDKPRGGAPGDEVKPDRRIVDETAEYVENVAQLFRLVAQNLETLSLVHYHGWLRLVPLLAIECPAGGFPMLRELTIVGSDPFVAKGTALSPFYPRLARLHVGFPTHFPWDMSLVDWATRAPGITHLCLSEVNGASPAIEDLADAPGVTFKHLRCLLLRPIGPQWGSACPGQLDHGVMVEALQLFCETAGIPAQVAPNTKRPGECVTTAKQEWLDRLAGGDGCWVMSGAGRSALDSEALGTRRRTRPGWTDLVRFAREKREATLIAQMNNLIGQNFPHTVHPPQNGPLPSLF